MAELRQADVLAPTGDSTPTGWPVDQFPLACHAGLRAPLVVSFALIFTCNLTCSHCYVGSTNQRAPDNWSRSEALYAVDILLDHDVFDIVFTGGEATLFEGYEQVLRRAKERGAYVALNTNGTTMNAAKAAGLAATGIDCVKVSIDSPRPTEHDLFRHSTFAFERAVRGVEAMVGAGIRVDLHTTMSVTSTRSRDDIDEMLALTQRLNATKLHVGRVFATGRADERLKLAEDELAEPVGYLHTLADDGCSVLGRIPGKTGKRPIGMHDYDGCGQCGNGVYAYLSYDGGLYPCTNLYKPPWKFGNLRTDSFEQSWTSSPVLDLLRQQLGTVTKNDRWPADDD